MPFPIDSTLFDLVSVAVEDAIAFDGRIKTKLSSDFRRAHVGSEAIDEGLKCVDRPSVRAVIDYIKRSAHLKGRFFPARAQWGSAMYELRIWRFIGNLADRYLNKYPNDALSRDPLLSEYLPLEKGHLADELPADLYIPIPDVRFKLKRIDLTDDAFITAIPPDIYLSRALSGKGSFVDENATHAFVLKSFVFRPGDRNIHDFILDEHSYPTGQIDLFFSVFRDIVDPKSGYSKIVTIPQGWACGYAAEHLPLETITIQRYKSDPIGNFLRYMSDSFPEVDGDQSSTLQERYIKADALTRGEFKQRVGVAIRRFTISHLRENEDDAVVDACIALEALFCGGDKEEITRTLSTRVAALSTLDRSFGEEAAIVYQNCKRIYSLRSKIVHGDEKKLEKLRMIRRGETNQSALSAAHEYIAMALRILSEHPRYLKSDLIDSDLLFRPR